MILWMISTILPISNSLHIKLHIQCQNVNKFVYVVTETHVNKYIIRYHVRTKVTHSFHF